MNIVFEDSSLLVIDKPPGLVVDKSQTQKTGTLENWLEDHYKIKVTRQGIVHRLDKDTSGLIVVAKTQEVLENLQKQFAGREVKKEYLALVHGLVSEGGVIEGNIARNPGNREKFAVVEDGLPAGRQGKEAKTEYEPIERLQVTGYRLQKIFPDFNKIQFRKLLTINYSLFTLLAVRPKTGRTHQIRVHLKLVSHPIVADEKYAGRKMVRLDKRWCQRQFLHAEKLKFKHPNGSWLELISPLPEDLQKALWTAFSYNWQ